MIKGIIFDLDGVLIDAKEWHYEALNKALGLFGYKISRYEHLVVYDGLPTRRKLEMLTLERDLPKSLHNFINIMKQQYTMEFIFTKCRPVFHHELALTKLKKEGYKLALCSNSVAKSVELMLRMSNLGQFFDIVLSNEDVSEPKPHPEIYLKAMSKLGIKARETLVIEDNDHGIKSAKEAGAHVLIVNNIDDTNYQNIKNCVKSCLRKS